MSDERLAAIAWHVALFADYGDRDALTVDDVRELLAGLRQARELCGVHHVAVIRRLTAEVAELRDQLAERHAANPPRHHRMNGGPQ